MITKGNYSCLRTCNIPYLVELARKHAEKAEYLSKRKLFEDLEQEQTAPAA